MASALRASTLCFNCARTLTPSRTLQTGLHLVKSSRLLYPSLSTNSATMCSPTQNESKATKQDKDTDNKLEKQTDLNTKMVRFTNGETDVFSESADEKRDRQYTESGAVDYSYFRNIIDASQAVNTNITKGPVPIDPSVLNQYNKAQVEHMNEVDNNESKVDQPNPTEDIENRVVDVTVTEAQKVSKPNRIPGLKNIKPKHPTGSYTLTPYVNDCQALKNLLSLGVDLTKIEKDRRVSNFLLTCDWEKDIQPYMVFLHKIGIPDSALGLVISRFPSIFIKSPQHLEENIQYLQNKKFTETEIATLVERAPTILNLRIQDLDANLGYLQKEFRLTGSEVRLAIIKFPKIAVYDKQMIQTTRRRMLDSYEFSKDDVKAILVSKPSVFLRDIYALEKTMEVLVDEMGLSRQTIAQNALLLGTRDRVLKQRHRFLKQVGRDQYDPEKPNYVSMKELVSGDDFKFSRVARVPVKAFRDFLKTL